MSDDGFEPIDTTGIDVDAAVAEMRRRIAGLGDAIVELEQEAARLNDSAAARMVVAVLDPPAVEPSAAVDEDLDNLAALSESVEAMGRHAAAPPEEFDPRPFDAGETGEGPIVAGEHGVERTPGAFDSLAAAPAFEPAASEAADERPEDLPAFDVPQRADTFGAPAESLAPNVSPDHPAVGDHGGAVAPEPDHDQEGPGATVLEFTPRSLNDPADAPAFGAPPAPPAPDPADEPAFGAVDESAPAPKRRAPDGLDAIASSESTDVPPDWDNAADEAAFDKFFSSDVEPEPAQRWLLNE
ncbi:MAG: hypothetical protein AAF480_01800 [Actinomycetota bacterium]